MDAFVMEIAGVAFQVIPLYETTRFYCRDYLTDREPEYMIRVQPSTLGWSSFFWIGKLTRRV